ERLGARGGGAPPDAEVTRVDDQVLLDAQVGVEALLLLYDAEPALDCRVVCRRGGETEDGEGAGARRGEAGDRADRRRRAGRARMRSTRWWYGPARAFATSLRDGTVVSSPWSARARSTTRRPRSTTPGGSPGSPRGWRTSSSSSCASTSRSRARPSAGRGSSTIRT